MTFQNTTWQVAQAPPDTHLRRFSGEIDPLLLQVLYNRGLTETAELAGFLSKDLSHSDDPFQLTGMEAAVGRIESAINAGESIVIYGDYDADGVTASVLLVQALRAMGAARVQPYIPHRIDEGYGLNNPALQQLAAQGNTLLITVDCGIRGIEQIEFANQLGLEVIVTDHHTVGKQLPPAAARLDPQQPGDKYPDRYLAGFGLAFKLVQGLCQAGVSMRELPEEDLLDLVALGTVADMAPLLDENRVLVHRGLKVLNRVQRPGIAALMQEIGVKTGQATAATIGFGLGPRINAAGRIAHAYQAARLLITPNKSTARQLAEELNDLNRSRQEQTRTMTALAATLTQEQGDAPLLFAAHPDFPSGIVGLIASRIMENHYRPAIAAHIQNDVTVASCRSIPEFHITDALDQCQDLLIKHGGHAAAAGFTVPTKDLAELQSRLLEIAGEQLSGQELIPTLNIDAELELSDIIWEIQETLAQLEPCGYANPTPLLSSSAVRVLNRRTVGRDNAHLKLTLAPVGENRSFDAIAFRMGDKIHQVTDLIDVVYHLETNEWNSMTNLQLNIKDLRPAQRPLDSQK